MTQQGKIAAALLKAGIRNPVTLADNCVQTEVRLREETAQEQRVLRRLATLLCLGHCRKARPLPNSASFPGGKSCPTPSCWEANLMIWGGPALSSGLHLPTGWPAAGS